MKIKEDFAKTAIVEWRPIPSFAAIGLAVMVAYILWQHFLTVDQWVFLLDSCNLAIHEAGHPFFGIFSSNLTVYGGTLFQLAFPLAFAWHFGRQRHGLGCAVSLVWFAESLMNVGRYMKDAQAQELPLVGGGDHDWTEIFTRWHVLAWDAWIGNATRLIGLLIAILTLLCLWRLLLVQKGPKPTGRRTWRG